MTPACVLDRACRDSLALGMTSVTLVAYAVVGLALVFEGAA